MSKIIVDQIQKLTGGTAAFNIPSADGTTGQFMKTDGSANLGWSSMTAPASGIIPGIVAAEGVGIIGSIYTHSDRENVYSTGEWTSNPGWTTMTTYTAHTDNSLTQVMNIAFGDSYSDTGTSQLMAGGDSERTIARELQFSNGARLGQYHDFTHWDNATSSPGFGVRIMPIRNTTGAAISINLYAYASDYYAAGYEGTCLFVLIPNTSTYSTVTTVSATRLAFTQNQTAQNALSGTYSVPANTTVLVVLCSTDCYQTTYRFKDTNYFYNLGTTFTNAGIICDMRMLSSLNQTRFNLPYAASAVGTSQLAPIWTKTATNYGDR